MRLDVCIWMNAPSHYQAAFYAALRQRGDVDLVVRYLQSSAPNRFSEGWEVTGEFAEFEGCVEGFLNPQDMLATVPNWQDRIHVACRSFTPALIDLFCRRKVRWCHWSEMPGINLAALLGYRLGLFRALRPLYLATKRAEGRRIATSALGAFAQGQLASQAFESMGIPRQKIADLFYSPEALDDSAPPLDTVSDFLRGRRAFLSVGSLCPRKGTDVLIRALANLKSRDWCLILCGLDCGNGRYQRTARRLGVDDRVLFLGAFPLVRIAEVYTACDVLLLASRFDGWGAVLNEAASVGLPLIATEMCGAAWHLVQNGENGFRTQAGSPQALGQAMGVYVENPELIATHGQASKELFLRDFTPGRNAERMVTALLRWMSP